MKFSRMWLIARREYFYNFSRKSYLFTAFVIPLFISGISYLTIYLAQKSESNLKGYEQVGYVDNSGLLADVSDPEGEFKRFVPYKDEASARAAFDTREIKAYIVIPQNYLRSGRLEVFSERGIPFALQDKFTAFLLEGVIAQNDQPPEIVERLREPLDQQIHLVGEKKALKTEALVVRVALPIVFGVFFMFNAVTTSQFLMSGVVEEKENRIMEILVTSCRPIELLTGKVVGLGALSITQMIFWIIISVGLGGALGRLHVLTEAQVKPEILLLSVVYFLMGFILFAGIMVGIGAATTAEQESRQFAAIFVLLAVLPPSWGASLFLTNPDHPIVIAMSLFPLTSPLANLALIGLGQSHAWQVILSLTILALSIVFVVWFSARIFRVGMLNYGQRLGLKQLRDLVRG